MTFFMSHNSRAWFECTEQYRKSKAILKKEHFYSASTQNSIQDWKGNSQVCERRDETSGNSSFLVRSQLLNTNTDCRSLARSSRGILRLIRQDIGCGALLPLDIQSEKHSKWNMWDICHTVFCILFFSIFMHQTFLLYWERQEAM